MNEKQQQHLYQLLGKNVKRYRNQRGLTQEQLANEISLTRTSVVNIEQGRQHPPLHLVLQIAKVLSINLETLVPVETEFAATATLVDDSLKDVKDEDRPKLTLFFDDFLKTSQDHE